VATVSKNFKRTNDKVNLQTTVEREAMMDIKPTSQPRSSTLALAPRRTAPEAVASERVSLGQSGLDAGLIKPLQVAAHPAQVVAPIAAHLLGTAWLTEGLDQAYSPNHPNGMTTRVHIEHQIQMVNHYVGAETANLQRLAEGDYDALQQMVANPSAPPALQVKSEDLRAFLEPLRKDLSPSDWKVLTVVAGLHDLGKMSPEWAKDSGLNLDGVEWIAHDFDTETLLHNNSQLLEPYNLDADEQAKVKILCRLHSLPGQYFFGEGNPSAYAPLFEIANQEGRESVLNLARIHGALDVMSALNHKFVKPILDSHVKLKGFISEAYAEKTPLGERFREVASHELQQDSKFANLAENHDLGPVAMLRLRRLVGAGLPPEPFETALASLDRSFVQEFQRATDVESTWFGTYVANAFGSGMVKALKEKVPPSEAIAATVKMVACAAHFHGQQGGRSQWALGALDPSLQVAAGPEQAQAVLSETQQLTGLSQAVERLSSGRYPLTMRAGESGVEIGFQAKKPTPDASGQDWLIRG